jgi:Leucine-rich repeat (LRR) protein
MGYASLMISLLTATAAQPWESCDFLPLANCSCKNPSHPHVSCRHLGLKHVPESLSQPNEWPAFASLDLSHNAFTYIPAGAFNQTKTTHLDISRNTGPLRFNSHSFVGASNYLVSLNLSNNNFTHEPRITYHTLRQLQEIDLSGNHLQVANHMHMLPKLSRLYLNGNELYLFDFARIKSYIHTLHISFWGINPGDHLKYLQWESLRYLHELKVVDSLIEMSRKSLSSFTSLKAITFIGCGLRTWLLADIDTFYNQRYTLEYLNLSYNNFKRLPTVALAPLRVLRSLSMSHNSLGDLRDYESLEIGTLIHLDLSYNGIRTISPNALLKLSSLEILNLEGNHLHHVNEDILPPNLRSLQLVGNPLHCDCELAWLIKLAGERVRDAILGSLRLRDIQRGLKCHSPSELAGKTLRQVYRDTSFQRQCFAV